MDWGGAFSRMLNPAALAGPFVGALGGAILIAFSHVTAGSPATGFVALVILIAGLILGAVIAMPLCIVRGAAMLWMASRDARWARRRAWATAGGLVGGGVGLALGWLMTDAEGMAFACALFAFLGLAGAMVCRHRLDRAIAGMSAVDADIFA